MRASSVGDLSAARAAPGVHLVWTAADVTDLAPMPCLAKPAAQGADRGAALSGALRRGRSSMSATPSPSSSPTTSNSAKSAAELIEVDYEPLPAVADTAAALRRTRRWSGRSAAPTSPSNTRSATRPRRDAAFAIGGARWPSSPSSTTASSATTWSRARSSPNTMRRAARFTVTVGSQGVHGMRDALCTGAEARSEAHARAHPRRRRRLRHQGLQLPGISAGGEGGEGARPAGEMGLRPQRAFPGRRARPRQRHDRRFRARRRRARHRRCAWTSPPPWAPTSTSSGRIIPWLAASPWSPASTTSARSTPLQGRLHQHRADRRLSRRRAARGGLFHRAADGRGGARRRAFAGRDPPAQFHQAGADALQDADGPRLRHRRVRRPHGQALAVGRRSGLRRRGWRRARRAAASAGSASPPISRSAPSGVPSRPRRCSRRTARQRPYRHPVERAGAPDRLRAVRGRAARRSTTTEVRVVQGDTDALRSGGGTGGSRSIPLGVPSVDRASRQLAEQIKELAADELEAGVGDIELTGGTARVVGTDRAITYAELARKAPDKSKLAGHRRVQGGREHLPERHACLRGRDRSGDRPDRDRRLHDRRRFRRDGEPDAARRPGAWRRRAGRSARR